MTTILKKEIIRSIEIEKQKVSNLYEIKSKTEDFTKQLFLTLFDKNTDIEQGMEVLENQFISLTELVCFKNENPCREIWTTFMGKLPEILRKLNADAEFIRDNDPAANSLDEVYLAYPGFYAIAIYRLSHALLDFGLPLVPRLMSECAHTQTGTDINPGAKIGVPFFIDHATGVVIGETSIIEDRVKIYQGVTLGGLSVDKSMTNKKRHPTIESDVTIYANATILGGETVIGKNSTIGGNVWLTKSVAESSTVTHQPHIKIKENQSS
ncbi:serine O-acetyltransferase EpsC [Psychroflexus aestuariivivens]|uniref:serine O-acetyltransferase EpsC n=1 Tax=Psychroflexus aestuariivivens TaxID=1795040 RepID=UPI000FDC45A2|nr:serine O-acetyltransferase EpsC [Psychroflexus aestuariivivens]